MKFCNECGNPVDLTIPEGDNLPRHVCRHCGTIHYVNPKVVVGCIAEWGDHILLCRRSIAPRYGLWTLPAGFMENGESTAQAAARETWEEAQANVDRLAPFSLVSVPHINQVHLFYRARLMNSDFAPGLETLETNLFLEESLPWQALAFRTVELCLRAYYADRRTGQFKFHDDVVRPTGL